jgi:hypothetical protein
MLDRAAFYLARVGKEKYLLNQFMEATTILKDTYLSRVIHVLRQAMHEFKQGNLSVELLSRLEHC